MVRSRGAGGADAGQAWEAIERMVRDVDAVSRLLQGRWVKNWVAEVGHLQPIEPKKIVVGEKEIDVDESYIIWGDMDHP